MHRTLIALAALSLVAATASAQDRNAADEWYKATGKTCSTTDVTAARSVAIKADKYNSATMISPDSAKLIALCLVPGQVTSGEMETGNGRVHYAIDIIPNKKKTHEGDRRCRDRGGAVVEAVRRRARPGGMDQGKLRSQGE